MRIEHEISPIYNAESKILLLGTMPSPKSREAGFFYTHPQNRFWRVLADILNENQYETIEDKTQMLLRHHIALWDVLKSCDIEGAQDSSIRNAIANDFSGIFEVAQITAVFTTGKTAEKYYKMLVNPECFYLPSPSPANCRVSLYELKTAYSAILAYI